MVDFQSRDTQRGASDEDETERSSDDATPASESTEGNSAEQSADPTADTDPDAGTPALSESGETESATPQSATPSRTLGIGVVTVGDPTQDGTPLAEALETAIESTGHEVAVSQRVAGEYDELQQVVDKLVAPPAVDVMVTAGGIGITPDERTIEAIHPMLEKALPGFGEAFRRLLFERVGTGIVAVRSTAGITDGTPVFCLPADPAAATLAIEEIVATEAPALVAQLDE